MAAFGTFVHVARRGRHQISTRFLNNDGTLLMNPSVYISRQMPLWCKQLQY